MSLPSYDVVLVAKKERRLLRTIQSLKDQTVPPHRIILVTADMKNFQIEGVEWHQEEGPPTGPSKPRNMGIGLADCRVVVGFDTDVEVPPFYMERALKRLVAGQHQTAVLIGGENRCRGRLIDRFNYRLIGLFSRFMGIVWADSIIGNNYVGWRVFLVGIQFDENIRMMEDADISRRYRRKFGLKSKSVRFYRDLYVYTIPRRVHKVGGWWRYLATYFKAYLEYRRHGNVESIRYFE